MGPLRFGAIDTNVDESNTPPLTPRERRCLELVARHFDSETIGAELGIAAGTVNRYIHDASRKLGARNRKEAARMLQEMDALGPPPSENWVRNGWVAPTPPSTPPLEPQSTAAPVTGWQRLLYFERPIDPTELGPGKRLVAMVGILLALSLGLGFAVIAAAGLMAIYGHLRF